MAKWQPTLGFNGPGTLGEGQGLWQTGDRKSCLKKAAVVQLQAKCQFRL